MIVALACTPPTETVWKTNLSIRDQRTRRSHGVLCEPTLPWQARQRKSSDLVLEA